MNKKVKWSVISVSAVTFFTFGGLVAKHQKGTVVQSNPTQNDNRHAYQDDDFNTDQGDSFGFTDGGQQDNDQFDRGQSSDWGQDNFQRAPSGGFEQGHGSSGSSR
ncbi:hypothetical protein QUF79_21215 [Fictibacillus enclensis]|uniref:hypothetical protein n=1 Tax=Fictibacillus enclensis TaxID=1017270 RepID=UPI00259FE981|nr:hypothetical protein [Fictibacillus enclensis]MDM5200542.1 hypothetical protein [Fictibacillus enclensis]